MKELMDIHAHILPCVDDGAQNNQISMEMLRLAWEDGIRIFVLTPHNKPMRHNVSLSSMKKIAEQLLQDAKENGMDFQFYLGNEIYYRSDIAEAIEEEKAYTMAGTSYVLTEFSPMDEFGYIRKGINKLLMSGYRPIIAHVERYQCMLEKPERVEELHAMGCYIQVNAGSVLGQYGFSTKRVCKRLLKKELVHFIASDAHDTNKRAPKLMDCVNYIGKKYGDGYMQKIFYDNPQKLLKDEYI